jgi:GABA(A) receptor-associated protein
MTFKDDKPFEKRREISDEIRMKHPDRIPCIVEPRTTSEPSIKNIRFLCDYQMTIRSFYSQMKNQMRDVRPFEVLFFFCQTTKGEYILVDPSKTLNDLQKRCLQDDGFMYFIFSREAMFG